MPLALHVDHLFTSPWAMSVHVALTEKELPFTLHTVNLEAGQQGTPAYLDVALTGRVPALVHDDFSLTESSAMTEYLEQVFPAPQYKALYPCGVRERARARQLQSWLRSDLAPLRAERDTETVFFKKPCAPLTANGHAAADKLLRAAERLIDGPNLFGAWSIVDTDLAIMLHRLILNGDAVSQKVKDYAYGQWQRASVQRWLALHQPS